VTPERRKFHGAGISEMVAKRAIRVAFKRNFWRRPLGTNYKSNASRGDRALTGLANGWMSMAQAQLRNTPAFLSPEGRQPSAYPKR